MNERKVTKDGFEMPYEIFSCLSIETLHPLHVAALTVTTTPAPTTPAPTPAPKTINASASILYHYFTVTPQKFTQK